MLDVTTQKPLQVIAYSTGRPYLMLPASQVEEVRRLLDSHGFSYWVDDFFISMNGEPETAWIKFGRETDAAAVQGILDSVH